MGRTGRNKLGRFPCAPLGTASKSLAKLSLLRAIHLHQPTSPRGCCLSPQPLPLSAGRHKASGATATPARREVALGTSPRSLACAFCCPRKAGSPVGVSFNRNPPQRSKSPRGCKETPKLRTLDPSSSAGGLPGPPHAAQACIGVGRSQPPPRCPAELPSIS